MKKTTIHFFAILFALLAFPAQLLAGVPASGEFISSKGCQAYQSIRKLNNPDDTTLGVGKSYSVIEANVADGSTWYRIRIENANPAERWVYFDCGTPKVTIKNDRPTSQQNSGDVCHIAGEADSYVFAISWQPAFCKDHADKPECKIKDPNSYQANNFTLHGLWPNKDSCEKDKMHLEFCGNKYKRAMESHCAYDPAPVTDATKNDLGKVMPSAAFDDSCLERHEWYKHGTCQTNWDANEYFRTAMRLLEEFNDKGMSKFMVDNMGQTVTVNAFNAAIDLALGAGAHTHMKYTCKHNKLVDINISLPVTIPADATLASLIEQAPPSYKNGCGNNFIVDPIDM
jgi:ribonuclease T2